MARKQTEIPGTERTDLPPELLDAGMKWLDQRKEARRATERRKEAKFAVITLMQSRKVEVFKILDEETGEYRTLRCSLEPKLTASKSGEVESEVGDAIGDGPSSPDVHPGLIKQAEKAQADANVEETSDGDVAVPETSVPKAKRGRKPKAKN